MTTTAAIGRDYNTIPATSLTPFRSIRRIEIPLPMVPGQVNGYLVPCQGGWILVDCGMNTPGALASFEQADIDLTSIKLIVLTHVHPDHSGLATVLRERTGAPVWMHRDEEEALKSLQHPDEWLARQGETLAQAGVPEPLLRRISSSALAMRRMFPVMRADRHLRDGDMIPTELGPMVAIHTPGHSAGHLCFHFPEAGILLSGDHLLVPATPHLDWNGPDSLGAYERSLDRLASLRVQRVMPGHGNAFRRLRDRIEELRAWIWQHTATIERLRGEGHATAHQIATARWNRQLSPFEHRCAVYETLAYMAGAPAMAA